MKKDKAFRLHNHMRIIRTNIEHRMHYSQFIQNERNGIFDIDCFSEKYYAPRIEWAPHNNYYGAEKVLREYAGINKRLNAFMEHGLQAYEMVEKEDIETYGCKKVVTFSNMRKAAIQHVFQDKYEICVVGPYISYAKSFYTEEEKVKLKEKYGRILTFFPAHTIYGMDPDKYDPEFEFVSEKLEQYKKKLNIDSIFVCGYWRDIWVDRLKKYKNAGYTIVSAGHAMSPLFLSRLKSIFEISDYAISDAFGTQIGYSLACNTPHCILTKNGVHSNQSNGIWFINETKAFDSFDKNGSKEQQEVLNYLWGLDQIKSPEELKKILL